MTGCISREKIVFLQPFGFRPSGSCLLFANPDTENILQADEKTNVDGIRVHSTTGQGSVEFHS